MDFRKRSLLQSTLELSSSTCIANEVESKKYFSQTPLASFLRSCKILRLFSLRVNLLCFPLSLAIVLLSGRYEQHSRRLFYAWKFILTAQFFSYGQSSQNIEKHGVSTFMSRGDDAQMSIFEDMNNYFVSGDTFQALCTNRHKDLAIPKRVSMNNPCIRSLVRILLLFTVYFNALLLLSLLEVSFDHGRGFNLLWFWVRACGWTPPMRAWGVKSRMCPPYPQRDRKRRLNGAMCRNHRIKRVVPCRC